MSTTEKLISGTQEALLASSAFFSEPRDRPLPEPLARAHSGPRMAAQRIGTARPTGKAYQDFALARPDLS